LIILWTEFQITELNNGYMLEYRKDIALGILWSMREEASKEMSCSKAISMNRVEQTIMPNPSTNNDEKCTYFCM